VTSSRSMRSA